MKTELKPNNFLKFVSMFALALLSVQAFSDISMHFNEGNTFRGILATVAMFGWGWMVFILHRSTVLTPEEIKETDATTTTL